MRCLKCAPNILDEIQLHVVYSIYCIVSTLRTHATRRNACGYALSIMGKRDYKLLQQKIWHEFFVSRLYNFRPSNSHSEWNAELYVYLCWFHPITSINVVCNVSRNILSASYCPCQNTSDVISRLRLVWKQNLTPKTFSLNTMFNFSLSLGRTVALSEQNTDHWLTCIVMRLFETVRSDTLCPMTKKNCVCSWVSFSVPFRRVVNRIY